MNTEYQNSMATSHAPALDSSSAEIVNTSKIYQWQYNGAEEYWRIVKWCLDTFGFEGWCYKNEMLYFDNDKDYEFFLLRWS